MSYRLLQIWTLFPNTPDTALYPPLPNSANSTIHLNTAGLAKQLVITRNRSLTLLGKIYESILEKLEKGNNVHVYITKLLSAGTCFLFSDVLNLCMQQAVWVGPQKCWFLSSRSKFATLWHPQDYGKPSKLMLSLLRVKKNVYSYCIQFNLTMFFSPILNLCTQWSLESDSTD